jgi:hypothetical protein
MLFEFPNLSTWSATLTVVQMTSQVEKAKCVLLFHKSGSAVTLKILYGVWKGTTNKNADLQMV